MLDRGPARERASQIPCERVAALLPEDVTQMGECDCEASIRENEYNRSYGK
jgi:hypothetical protein